MTERTVTNQTELDTAITDPTVTTITIDSPAGVWLNIGDTGQTTVNVAGKSTVDKCSGSVEWVTGSGRVGRVTGSGSVGEVTGSGSVGEVTGSGRVGRVTGSGSVEWVTGSGSVGEVTDFGSVGEVTGSGRVGWVTGSGRVEWVTGSGRVGGVTDSGSVGEVTDSGSVGRVTGSGSVEWVTGSGSVGEVTDSGSVEKATATAVIQAVRRNATVNAEQFVAVHLYSATATVTGGHIIDLTRLDDLSGEDYCAAMGIDHERLQAELEHITAHPQEWNQGLWAQKTACGTACCLAGGTVLHAGIPLKWEPDGSATYTERGTAIENEARLLLGLPSGDSQRLFSGSNSLGRLWWLATEVTRGAVKIPATVVVGDEDRADEAND